MAGVLVSNYMVGYIPPGNVTVRKIINKRARAVPERSGREK